MNHLFFCRLYNYAYWFKLFNWYNYFIFFDLKKRNLHSKNPVLISFSNFNVSREKGLKSLPTSSLLVIDANKFEYEWIRKVSRKKYSDKKKNKQCILDKAKEQILSVFTANVYNYKL